MGLLEEDEAMVFRARARTRALARILPRERLPVMTPVPVKDKAPYSHHEIKRAVENVPILS